VLVGERRLQSPTPTSTGAALLGLLETAPPLPVAFQEESDAFRPVALSAALVFAAMYGMAPVIPIALARGADVNALYRSSSPLVMAAQGRSPLVVRLLLEAGADALQRDRSVLGPPLYCATSPAVVQELLKGGARVWDGTYDCMRNAVSRHRVHVVRAMVQWGASPNSQDGSSPYLRRALHSGETRDHDIARLLVEAGANVNASDGAHPPPLHCAVVANEPTLMHLLLDHGADPCAEHSTMFTPVKLATAAAPPRLQVPHTAAWLCLVSPLGGRGNTRHLTTRDLTVSPLPPSSAGAGAGTVAATEERALDWCKLRQRMADLLCGPDWTGHDRSDGFRALQCWQVLAVAEAWRRRRPAVMAGWL